MYLCEIINIFKKHGKKKQVNNLYLIGAGFTKAVFHNAPLNIELLERLIENNPADSILQKYKEKYHSDDIQELLTNL